MHLEVYYETRLSNIELYLWARDCIHHEYPYIQDENGGVPSVFNFMNGTESKIRARAGLIRL